MTQPFDAVEKLKERLRQGIGQPTLEEEDWSNIEGDLRACGYAPVLLRATIDLAKKHGTYHRAVQYLNQLVKMAPDLKVTLTLECARITAERLLEPQHAFDMLYVLLDDGHFDFDVIHRCQRLAITVDPEKRLEVLMRGLRSTNSQAWSPEAFLATARSAVHSALQGQDRSSLAEIQTLLRDRAVGEDILVELEAAVEREVTTSYTLSDISGQGDQADEIIALSQMLGQESVVSGDDLYERIDGIQAQDIKRELLFEAGHHFAHETNNLEEAERFWLEGIRLGEFPDAVASELGRYYAAQKNWERVEWVYVEQLKVAVLPETKARQHVRLGELYVTKHQDHKGAIAHFQQALALIPSHAEARRALGELYASEQMWQAAYELCLHEAGCVDRVEEQCMALNQAAYIAEKRLGDIDSAIQVMRRLIALRGLLSDRLRLMMLLERVEDFASALDVFERMQPTLNSEQGDGIVLNLFMGGLSSEAGVEWLSHDTNAKRLAKVLSASNTDLWQDALEACLSRADGTTRSHFKALLGSNRIAPETQDWHLLWQHIQNGQLADFAEGHIERLLNHVRYQYDVSVILAENAIQQQRAEDIIRFSKCASDFAPTAFLRQSWSLTYLDAMVASGASVATIFEHLEAMLNISENPISIYRYALELALRHGDRDRLKDLLHAAQHDERLHLENAGETLGLAGYEVFLTASETLTAVDEASASSVMKSGIDVEVSFETYEPSEAVLDFQNRITGHIAEGEHEALLETLREFLTHRPLQGLDIEGTLEDVVATLGGEPMLLDFTRKELRTLKSIPLYDGGRFVAEVVERFTDMPQRHDDVHVLIREALDLFRSSEILLEVGRAFTIVSQTGVPVEVMDDSDTEAPGVQEVVRPEIAHRSEILSENKEYIDSEDVRSLKQDISQKDKPKPNERLAPSIKENPPPTESDTQALDNERLESMRQLIEEQLDDSREELGCRVATFWADMLSTSAQKVRETKLLSPELTSPANFVTVCERSAHPSQRHPFGCMMGHISTAFLGLSTSTWIAEHGDTYLRYPSNDSEPFVQTMKRLCELSGFKDFEVWLTRDAGHQGSVIPDHKPIFIVSERLLQQLDAHLPLGIWLIVDLMFGHHLVNARTDAQALYQFGAAVLATCGDDRYAGVEHASREKIRMLLSKGERHRIRSRLKEMPEITIEDAENWLSNRHISKMRVAYIFGQDISWVCRHVLGAQLNNMTPVQLVENEALYHLMRFSLSQDALELKKYDLY